MSSPQSNYSHDTVKSSLRDHISQLREQLDLIESTIAWAELPSGVLNSPPLLRVHPPDSREAARWASRKAERDLAFMLRTVRDLQRGTAAFASSVANHHSRMVNSPSPAAAIPPEILAQIFVLATAEVDMHTEGDGRKVVRFAGAVVLSQVCQHWRETAIGTTSLWCNIALPMPSDYLALYSTRSGDRPIRLTIWDDPHQPCIATESGFKLLKHPEHPGYSRLLYVLQKRISDLTLLLKGGDGNRAGWLHNVFDQYRRLNSLHTLTIEGLNLREADDDLDASAEHALVPFVFWPQLATPSLRTVTLTNVNFEKPSGMPTVSELMLSLDARPDDNSMLRTLASFSHIESLDLSSGGAVTGILPNVHLHNGPVFLLLQFPNLVRLTLRDRRNHACQAFMVLDRMDAPCLKTLIFHGVNRRDNPGGIFCRSNALDRVLHTTSDADMISSHVRTSRFPSVTTLELHGLACVKSTLKELIVSTRIRKQLCLPNLEILNVDCSSVDGTAYRGSLILEFQAVHQTFAGRTLEIVGETAEPSSMDVDVDGVNDHSSDDEGFDEYDFEPPSIATHVQPPPPVWPLQLDAFNPLLQAGADWQTWFGTLEPVDFNAFPILPLDDDTIVPT